MEKKLEEKVLISDWKPKEGLVELLLGLKDIDHNLLSESVKKILRLKVENEVMISLLLTEGVAQGKITVEEASKIMNKSKDSISDLIRMKQLLDGLPTEIVNQMNSEEVEELKMLREAVRVANG